MSTTKTKRQTKSASSNVEARPRTIEQIEAEIAKHRKTVECSMSWMHRDRCEKAELAIVELQKELELVQVRQLPAPAAVATSFEEKLIDVASIVITGNHREHHDPAATERLAASIRTQGLQQRIGVRDMGGGHHELIFGSRRLAAAKLAAIAQIPAKVYAKELTAAQVEILRTIENFGRKNLTPVEEAVAVARTIDAIEKTLSPLDPPPHGMSLGGTPGPEFQELARSIDFEKAFKGQPEKIDAARLRQAIDAAGGLEPYVGQQFGRSAKWVKDHAYISKLGGQARQLLTAGRIDIAHARELAKLGDKEEADGIAELVARNEQGLGGQSVDRCRQYVQGALRSLRVVPWRLDVAFGKDVKGCTGYACSTCPFNSKSDPDLFGGMIADEPDAGVCTNGSCFEAKTEIVNKELTRAVKKAEPVVKKAIVAAKKDLAPGDELGNPITKSSVGHLVPPMVKTDSGVRRMQKDLSGLVAAQSPSSSNDEAPSLPTEAAKPTPESIAQEKLTKALGKWREQVRNAFFGKVFEDTTGRRVLALMCLEADEFATELDKSWREPEGAKRVIAEHDQQIRDAIDCDMDSLGRLAVRQLTDDLEERLAMLGGLEEQVSVLLYEKLARGWGAELPTEPTLDEFLPKPKKPKREPAVAETAGGPISSEPYPIERCLHLTAERLEESLGSTLIRPQNPNEPAPDQAVTGIPIHLGGEWYVVTGAAMHLKHADYRLHRVDADMPPLFENFAARAAKIKKQVAPEDVPLCGIAIVDANRKRYTLGPDSECLTIRAPRHTRGINVSNNDTFEEDEQIFDADVLGLTIGELEKLDATDAITKCTKMFATVRSVEFDSYRWIVLGTQQVRGQHCLRLAQLAQTSKADLGHTAANTAAERGDFDGIGVIDAADGKKRRRICAQAGHRPPCLIYVRTSSAPAGKQLAGVGA